MWLPNFYFFTHSQRNLTQLDYFLGLHRRYTPSFQRKLKTWCEKAQQIQMKFREL